MSETIDILLATCNGEPFIAELLDSVLAQSVADWRLTVSDDGSTDCTVRILDAYRSRHPDRITLLASGKNKGGQKIRGVKSCNATFPKNKW